MRRNVLLVGSWAKEHITVENLNSDPSVTPFVYLDTRNPGIQDLAEECHIGSLSDIDAIVKFAEKIHADLVIPTTASPLANGLIDALEESGISSFGPKKAGARLEFDKAFTRNLLQKWEIGPIPRYRVFDEVDSASAFAEELDWKVAIKPIGLTEGLGVKVAGDQLKGSDQINAYIQEILQNQIGGQSALIVEEKLTGIEFTLQCLVNGDQVVPTPLVQDFKKLLPGDEGPNTASMGSYSAANGLLPYISRFDCNRALQMIQNTLSAFEKDSHQSVRGFLYGQFMLTTRGPIIIEFNFRPGDPEWMDVMARMNDSLFSLIQTILDGQPVQPHFEPCATTCKYLVPKDYPEVLDSILDLSIDSKFLVQNDCSLYYSGGLNSEGKLQVGSERGIALIAKADRIEQAHRKVEEVISSVKGEFFHRSDIGSAELIQSRKKEVRKIQQQRSEFRIAREDDFLKFHAFTKNCPPLENYPAHIYKILLRYFGDTCFVTEINGEIVGFVLGFPCFPDHPTYFLWQIGIHPELQGVGQGQILLPQIERVLKQKGIRRIEVTIDPENIPSMKLFENCGYQNISRSEGETVRINQLEAVKDYYSPGRHFMLFEKTLIDR